MGSSTRTCVTDENDVMGEDTPKFDTSRMLDSEVASYNCAASMPGDCTALITDRSWRQCVSDEPLILQVATPIIDCSRSAEFSVVFRLQQLSDEAKATPTMAKLDVKRRRDGADSPDRMRQPMDDLVCMNRSVAPSSGAALSCGYDAEEHEHFLRRTRMCLQHGGDNSNVLDEPTPVLEPRTLGSGAAEGTPAAARTSPRPIEQERLMRRSRMCLQHGDDSDVSDVLDKPTPVLQLRPLGSGAADGAPAAALKHADSPRSVGAMCAQGLSGGVLVAPAATVGGAGGEALCTLSADVSQVRSEMSDLSAKLDKLLLLMGDPSQQ